MLYIEIHISQDTWRSLRGILIPSPTGTLPHHTSRYGWSDRIVSYALPCLTYSRQQVPEKNVKAKNATGAISKTLIKCCALSVFPFDPLGWLWLFDIVNEAVQYCSKQLWISRRRILEPDVWVELTMEMRSVLVWYICRFDIYQEIYGRVWGELAWLFLVVSPTFLFVIQIHSLPHTYNYARK